MRRIVCPSCSGGRSMAERSKWQAGGIGSTITRSDPPPKHKNNRGGQPRDIAGEALGLPVPGAAPCAQPGKSTSISPGLVKARPESEERARRRAVGGAP